MKCTWVYDIFRHYRNGTETRSPTQLGSDERETPNHLLRLRIDPLGRGPLRLSSQREAANLRNTKA